MPWEKQFDVDEVLEKAMHAFWSRGYEATSMQDLVERTGVNRGSLYATYHDKHSLFLAALRMYDERQRHQRLQALEASHGPREAIRQLLLSFASGATDSCGNRGCFLTNTALELAAHDREAGRIVAAAQQAIEAFFERMIRLGQAAGEIGAGVDPDETAAGLLASLAGLAVLSRSRPEPKLMQAILSEADRRLG
jgi:TetR/AcrR family transcriptional repressor of nem operon